MNDVLTGMNQSTAFVILAFLLFVFIVVGAAVFRQWLIVRKAQIEKDDKDSQREAETAKYRAELAATTAKYEADSQQRQYEKDERQAVLWSQMVVAMDGIISTQKQTRGAVGKSEETVKQAVTSSEGRVVAAVAASKDDVIRVVRLLGKVNTDVFQPVASEPPDLAAMQIILEDTLAAIEAAKKRMLNAPARVTSEVPAAEPAKVVIADISPTAIETLANVVGTMMPAPDAGAATEGDEELDKAS